MRGVTLNGGVSISRLGFGTGNLSRLDTRRGVVRLLDAAFDAGVTHFDTARLYGHGTMERTVGEFLRGKRDRVTVTTKFGLDPLLRGGRLRPLLNAAKFIVKKIPALRRRAAQIVHANTAPADRRQQYSRERAERALGESLRELGTDYIDIYLLHEANPETDVSDELLAFLHDRKQAGVIRAFGCGSAYGTIQAASATARAAQDVMQFESDACAPNVRALAAGGGGCSMITHGVYRSLPRLMDAAARQPEIARGHAVSLGADPTVGRNVSRWMLGHALRANPGGGVLISTVQPDRLRDSVQTADDPPGDEELDAFENYVRALDR